MTLGFANCDDKQDRRWMRYNLASPLPVVVYSNDQLQVDALGNVIKQWITHLLSIEVEIEALTEATDVNLIWYVGLDAEATAIGDALWNYDELDQAARERIIGLYRVTFRDSEIVLDKARGEPIYLILAMTPDRMLRMKPQNLVTGLPIAHFEAVS